MVVDQSLNCVRPFATPWTAACQASLSFTISWNLLKLMFIESVMPFNHLILCRPPFCSCPQSFPESRCFPICQFFPSSGQSVGASVSASVLPVIIQDRFPIGLAGLISLLSDTTVRKYHFFGTQSFLWYSVLFIIQLSHL